MSDELSNLLAETARLSKRIPDDITFYATMYPEIQEKLQSIRKRLLKSLNALLAVSAKDSDYAQSIHDLEDLEDHYQSVVVNTVDDLFEEADQLFDEIRRQKAKTVQPPTAHQEAESFLAQHLPSSSTTSAAVTTSNASVILSKTDKKPVKAEKTQPKHVLDRSLRYAGHIMKPQIRFEDDIDNSHAPFLPKLKFKHNARVPYEPGQSEAQSLPDHVRDHMKSLGLSDDDAGYADVYLLFLLKLVGIRIRMNLKLRI
jgi:hypothetical protein